MSIHSEEGKLRDIKIKDQKRKQFDLNEEKWESILKNMMKIEDNLSYDDDVRFVQLSATEQM